MSEKMRDEFEVWACNYNLKIADLGNYADRHVNNMWKAWRASRAALVVELPEKAALMSASSVYAALDDVGVSYK